MALEHDRLRLWVRLSIGIVLGLIAGVAIPLPPGASPIAATLVGFSVGAVAFSVPFLALALRMDTPSTVAHVDGQGDSRTLADVLVVVAALASLAGVANLLLFHRVSGAAPALQAFEAGVSLLAVAAGWLLVHTMYTLRYCRHAVNSEPGCITFGGDAPPRMSDYAYLSFCLGMTFQVSDQTLTTPTIRRIVLFHTLLSYLFGTVIVATTINLVAGLSADRELCQRGAEVLLAADPVDDDPPGDSRADVGDGRDAVVR